jgi:hypothetical protein
MLNNEIFGLELIVSVDLTTPSRTVNNLLFTIWIF